MNSQKVSLFAVLTALILPQAIRAQIATIDVSNPTNAVVTADENPDLYAPDVPPDPTTIYLDELTLPATSTITSANYVGLAYVVLLNEGVVLATANLEGGQYLALQPTVVTNDSPPDTYSTYPPVVYYTAPANNPPTVASTAAGPFNFDFGTASSPVASGYVRVSDQTAYSAATGFGWGDPSQVTSQYRASNSDPLKCDWCQVSTNGTPFYLDLANGHYFVSVLAGDASTNRTTFALRANGAPEGAVNEPAGKYTQFNFPIEISDNRLRLEFIGSLANVDAVTVTRDYSPHLPTVFVAGDSTAAAYAYTLYPLTGWADRLRNYLTSDVVVEDDAVAGTSSRDFVDRGYLDVITSRLRPGDYLFVCFGINDRYSDARHTDPETTYKAYLRVYINAARAHGAIPVLVAEQTMRTYDPYGRFYNNIGGYPQAMRELAPEVNVPLIDLNAKSINLFNVVGPAATGDMFMFFGAGEYPAWPNGRADYIHFQDRGATVLGKQVADSVRELDLPIAKYVLPTPIPAVRPASRGAYQ